MTLNVEGVKGVSDCDKLQRTCKSECCGVLLLHLFLFSLFSFTILFIISFFPNIIQTEGISCTTTWRCNSMNQRVTSCK